LPALGLALLVSIPTNLFVVGLGLVIASSFKNDNLAANIGTLASVILGFLSGAFLNFPDIKVFGSISLTSLIPSTYATEAFRKVLQFNKGLPDIIPELTVLTTSAIVLILIGSWAYNKFQLKNLVG
jgi:ABC-type multidrug transport system permease subunit